MDRQIERRRERDGQSERDRGEGRFSDTSLRKDSRIEDFSADQPTLFSPYLSLVTYEHVAN